MRESLKKPLLFFVIVVVGSLLVLFDIPLLILIPLVIVVGFATLLALGSITIAEMRTGLAGMGKTGFLKKLNEIKFFEKKAPGPAPAPAKPALKKEVKKEEKKASDRPGIRGHLSAFFSSVRSLGSVMQLRSKQDKKVEDINKLLDRTVTEKVTAPPPAAQQKPAGSPSLPAPSGGGASSASDDPFVSLSGDEFDEELLKGLDDGGDLGLPPAEAGGPSMDDLDLNAAAGDILKQAEAAEAGGPGTGDAELDAAAADILKQAGEAEAGPEDFPNPAAPGGETIPDEDFGDLDNLSLDDVGIDDEQDAAAPGMPSAPMTQGATGSAPATGGTPAPEASGAVKTAWIPSDAPKDAGETADEISTQADMAAFASGPGGDEDLLSSIASDVKHTKKDVDISLVRELKDFRAPASEIEKELGGMYERMNLTKEAGKKKPGSAGKK